MIILMIIVGSRRDVQPFVALGRHIRDKDGTAIAIATVETLTPQTARH